MTKYAVALGSNQGDRAHHLRAAADEISRLGSVLAVSALYETAPVGGPEQGPYLNAVLALESPLFAHDLLERLQTIESGHGRERTVRWGPRTLDLDIIAMEGGSIDITGLQIPHPRAAERRFVLDPLCDVWPDAVVGEEGLTAAEARERLGDQEVDLLMPDWVGDDENSGRYWVAGQLTLFLAIALAIIYDGSLPGTDLDGVRVGGALLLVMGGALILAAARSLGRALTIMPEPVSGASLVETGVYSKARHPMYGGVFLLMLGASLLLASLIGAVTSIGLLVFFWAKSGYEERRLRIAYPGYSAYRQRVPRRMIPYLI
jgi:2-amino-4-hydroxy-6-hydroxymethyldihydropteridine diphosphokinase